MRTTPWPTTSGGGPRRARGRASPGTPCAAAPANARPRTRRTSRRPPCPRGLPGRRPPCSSHPVYRPGRPEAVLLLPVQEGGHPPARLVGGKQPGAHRRHVVAEGVDPPDQVGVEDPLGLPQTLRRATRELCAHGGDRVVEVPD